MKWLLWVGEEPFGPADHDLPAALENCAGSPEFTQEPADREQRDIGGVGQLFVGYVETDAALIFVSDAVCQTREHMREPLARGVADQTEMARQPPNQIVTCNG